MGFVKNVSPAALASVCLYMYVCMQILQQYIKHYPFSRCLSGEHSLHEKTAASVLLKLFISSNE